MEIGFKRQNIVSRLEQIPLNPFPPNQIRLLNNNNTNNNNNNNDDDDSKGNQCKAWSRLDE
jgi:hypothetical protein